MKQNPQGAGCKTFPVIVFPSGYSDPGGPPRVCARPPRAPEMLRGEDKASRAPPPSPWPRSLPALPLSFCFPTRGRNPRSRRRPPLPPFRASSDESPTQEPAPRRLLPSRRATHPGKASIAGNRRNTASPSLGFAVDCVAVEPPRASPSTRAASG